MLREVLTVLGPALTTAGAGLLAYDVLRAPVRLKRRHRRTARLDAADRDRDDTVRSLADPGALLPTGEHEAAVAAIDATFASRVEQVETAYEDADTLERDRAFRLALWGLVFVVLGGIAETIAAVLAAARP